jgi:hypothetical protein
LAESCSWDSFLKYKEDIHAATTIRKRRRSFSGGTFENETPVDVTPLDLTPLNLKLLGPKAPSPTNASRRRPKKERGRNPYLIPSDHPYKIAWDLCTILLSVLSLYHTHLNIKNRKFSIHGLTEIWFLIDIILNFLTEHKSTAGRTYKAVWARYLTTWFVVDALSWIPWETLYVQPLFDAQKRRGFFVKSFFRTRAVIKVTRVLRGHHFKLFGKVAKQTKHAGVGANRLLRLLIKYVPKYLLFYRNMKGVLVVRVLRQVHWVRKLVKNISKQDDATSSLTLEQEEQDMDDYDDEEEEDEDDDDDNVQVFFDDGCETDL